MSTLTVPALGHLATFEKRLGARYSAASRYTYLSHARQFLRVLGEKPSYSRDDLLGYIDRLINLGHGARTINATLSALRTFFDATALTWPLSRLDLRLGLPETDVDAPALANEEVAKLIKGVRDQPGLARTVVGLSTIYGLRADELHRAVASVCDGRVLLVQTAKGGRKREHQIPPFLFDVLVHGERPSSARTLHRVFEDAMERYVREPSPREGWHAIRRSVVTGLLDANVEQRVIHRWFGWKSDKEIALKYWHPDPSYLDKIVYEKHPFLACWG